MRKDIGRGVIAVAATPFDEHDKVDTGSLRRYVRDCLRKRVMGFAAPAMAGEAYQLSEDERELVVATIMDENAGAVPVIGCATAETRDQRVHAAETVVRLGCDGVLVHIPYESETAHFEEFRTIASLGPDFIMVQDLDSSSIRLPVEVIANLFHEIEEITWAKVEVTDRCRKITDIRNATNGELRVASAGPLMIELLDRSVSAYMPTLYHDIYDEVLRRYDAHDRAGAAALFSRLLPNLVFHTEHPRMAHTMNKRMLVAQGIFAHPACRIEQEDPDIYESALMDELIKDAIVLSDTL